MAIGTFLFVLLFLRASRDVAVAGAVLNVALYYFFHEQPVITSAILLPALIGYLSICARSVGARVLLVSGAALVMALSNPPWTLVVMPLGHLALAVVAPAPNRRHHLIRWGMFWCLYGLYYAPTMAAQIFEFGNSNRSLFKSSAGLGFLAEFKEFLFNPFVISPAVVLLSLMNRRTWRGTVLVVVVLAGVVALTAANQAFVVHGLAVKLPAFLTLSGTYYRLYYFSPVVVFLWASWLMREADAGQLRTYVWRLMVVAGVSLAGAYYLSGATRVFEPFWRYSLVLGLAMGINGRWWTRRPWSVLLVGGAIVLFSRYTYTQVFEVPTQGNLFVEEPHAGPKGQPFRTVTVMRDCGTVDVYPAQAGAVREETLDGLSNFYDRAFAERWRHYVADNPALCTAQFAMWNTRVELTLANLRYAPQRILPWLWINNVAFVRSVEPLQYPELEKVDEREFAIDGLLQVPRYLYRFRSPVGRVFTIPERLASVAASGDFDAEERVLYDLWDNGGVSNMTLQTASASRLRFSGGFDEAVTLVANMNYHPGWSLYIDGRPSPVPVQRGPFGMLGMRPTAGTHAYELVFASRETWLVPVCMIAAFVLLWLGSRYHPALRRPANS